jgi:protocatechuate 3,4-dioxygenase beta subunit
VRRALLAVAGLAALAPLAGAHPWQGTVTDEDGQPVAGATVTLSPLDGPYDEGRRALAGGEEAAASAATGGDGRWRLDGAPGARRLCISAPGFVAFATAGVGHPSFIEAAEVSLARDLGLTVRVVDGEGRPVAGARLFHSRWVFAFDAAAPGCPLPVTGDDGTARLPRGEPATVAVLAVPPAGRTDLLPSPLREVAAPGATLVLPQGSPRRLAVRWPDGRPAAGALVEVRPGVPLAAADEAGRVTLAVPLDGAAVRRRVLAAGGFHAAVELAAAPRSRAADAVTPAPPVLVGLEPPDLYRGRVVALPDRRPVAGAVVLWSPEVHAVSGADGTFSLVRVPGGDAHHPGRLAAWTDGFVPRDVAPPLAPADGIELQVAPAAAIAGWVVDAAGHAVAGAEVGVEEDLRLRYPEMGWAEAAPFFAATAPPVRSGPDGDFRLAHVDPGHAWGLRVEHPDFAPARLALPPPGAEGPADELRIVLHRGTTLTVHVLGGAGQPLAGTAARAAPPEGDGDPLLREDGWTPCSADGRCRIAGLAAGRVDLRLAAPGHAPAVVRGVRVPDGGEVDLGTWYLEPEAEIRGTVLDAAGEPVPGADVRSWPDPSHRAAADATGAFVLAGLVPGQRLDLQVTAGGFVPARLARVEAPAADLDVRLAAGASVSGIVVDTAGEPQADVSLGIEPVPASGRTDGGLYGGTESADDGSFRQDGLPAGTVLLVPWGRGRPVVLSLEPGEHRDDARVVLDDDTGLLRFTGRVVDTAGRPVAGAEIGLRAVSERSELPGPVRFAPLAQSGADGRFAAEVPLPPDSRGELRAAHPDHLDLVQPWQSAAGEVHAEMVLRPGAARVAGRVLGDTGDGLDGARVDLVRGAAGPDDPWLADRSQSTTAGAGGRFRFDGIEPGRYRVHATLDGWMEGGGEALAVAAGDVAEVELRPSRGSLVHGRVLGLDRGADGHVVLRADEETGARRHDRLDHEGRFRFPGMAPGSYRLHVLLEGLGSSLFRAVEVPDGGGDVEVELEVAGGHEVAGEVRSAGLPLPDVGLRLAAADGARGHARSDHLGRFRFRRVPPGRYRLQVEELGYEEEIDVPAAGELRVEVALADVSGRVLGPSGEAVPAVVELVPDRGGDAVSPDFLAFGHFRFRVPAGAYRLRAAVPGGPPVELLLSLPAGRTDALELRLPAAAEEVSP